MHNKIKILFICGSLEPGKDGVGDYTRRLGCALIRQGASVAALALNDYYSNEAQEAEQDADGVTIPVLRIPSLWAKAKQTAYAKQWVSQFNPEWISLQFVPYSFHYKGLPFGLAAQLKALATPQVKWHIMFHELWLGLREQDSLKFRCIGTIQKLLVKSLMTSISFQSIHTHTRFYLNELDKLNLNPIYLPIFSNIPYVKMERTEEVGITKTQKFVMFGTIHPKAPITEFADEIVKYYNNETGMDCSLVLVGKSGNEKEQWVQEFKKRKINVSVLGELSSQEVSFVLQEATFGITTNPVFVLEKSGTVAAMREHNLPILIVAEETKPRDGIHIKLDDDFLHYSFGNLSKLMEKRSCHSNSKGLNEVSNQFVKDLKNNKIYK
ncbi:hypothetical protein [Mariniflexile sp.]|uniref:hypothetical protein n=1 Tax=Mariniflexile sp. TaxID=1979402 RepID=UPI003567A06C